MSGTWNDDDGSSIRVETGGGGGGCDEGFLEMIFIIAVVAAVIIGIFKGVVSLLTDNGILKSKYTVTLEESAQHDLNGGEVTLTLRDTDGEREYVETFAEEGESTVIKVHKGTYTFIMEYEDFQYNAGYQYIKGTGKYNITVSLDALCTKAVLLELEDEDGAAIQTDTVSVYFTADGSSHNAILMDGGYYLLLASIGPAESGSMEIQADGYESAVIEYSALSGVTKIAVQMEEAS